MNARVEAPHEPTRAELEDLFRDAVASLDEPDDDDGEREACDECGESFNVNESGSEDYCPRHVFDHGGDK